MLKGRSEAEVHEVLLNEKKARVMLELSARPLRLDIDPAFDRLQSMFESRIRSECSST